LIEYRWLYLRATALALVFAGLVAGVGWIGNELDVGPGRVPVWDPEGRGYWLTGIVLVLATAFSYRMLDYPPVRARPGGRSVEPSGAAGEYETNWVLPTIVVLAAVLMLGVYRGVTAIALGGLITFVGLLSGTVARHMILHAGPAARDRARIVFTLVIHGIAFLALAMIYIHKVRSLFSATAVMFIGVALLLALSEGEHELFNRRLVYALVGGIMLGQVTWSLNYWQATGWTGGAVLLVCFYLFGGMILTQFRRGVHIRDVVEYGSVSAIAFGIVVYSLFV
jgi:hypothetical protein